MKKVSSVIAQHLSNENPVEAIKLVENELRTIIAAMLDEGTISEDYVMPGNASILEQGESGNLVILTDEGEELELPACCYKGTCREAGTRIQCGIMKNIRGKKVCVDAMECLDFKSLCEKMFALIESRNMSMAATMAWAIYDNASEENKQAMKTTIHMLRNYMRRQKKAPKTELTAKQLRKKKLEEEIAELRNRIAFHFNMESPDEAITAVEEELDDILDTGLNEGRASEDDMIRGNATIIGKAKYWRLLIRTDKGEELEVVGKCYKGTNKKPGTRVFRGETRMIRDKEVCIFAMECTTLRELRYQLFSLIDERKLAYAVTVARAISYQLPKREKAMLNVTIDLLRRYVKNLSVKAASSSLQEAQSENTESVPLRETA